MWVTIYTDATYVYEVRTGAWATYCKCDTGTLEDSGVCPPTHTPTECEIIAVIKAVEKVVEIFENVSALQINSDSMVVVERLGKKRLGKNKEINALITQFWELIGKHKLFTAFKHVKGHTGKDDSRSFMNSKCDGRAKRTITEYIKTISYDTVKAKADSVLGVREQNSGEGK